MPVPDPAEANAAVTERVKEALAARRVRFVQFEYGGYNIYSRYLLRDFHDFFEARGYAVGKLFPDFVDFRRWQPSDEDFIGGNYVACPGDDPLLARLPAGRWRIGHFERPLPDGYWESLDADRNLIRDPAVHELYDVIRTVTRGPLWSLERWRAILVLNMNYPEPSEP